MNVNTVENAAPKTKKPIIAGLLSIADVLLVLSIALGMLFGEYKQDAWQALIWFWPFLLIFGIARIVGGIFALQRIRWLLSLIGSAGGMLMFYLAVPALALIITSKAEFK